MRLYNTLSRSVEEFTPLNPSQVGIYTCGPTVYDYAHIGNFRTYTLGDILVRTLKYFNYPVLYVSNITDVGHLVSDSDDGEDKMEKGARREGKSAWDIANYFIDVYEGDAKKLNLLTPDSRPRATAYIPEQIDLVQKLLDKRYAYQIDDGIYYDTSKFKNYGQLTGQNSEDLKAGARVEVNPQKRNPLDFALWKFSPKGQKRQMEWESPWGMGFPGWHIECSAMIFKLLGEQIDIHAGGMDLIPVHHTNEIAQSEAASDRVPFAKYWVHGQFIQVDGEKMSKSKGNFYRLADIEERNYDPLALRYLYFTSHYRSYLNFTWEGLTAAQNSLMELRKYMRTFTDKAKEHEREQLSEEKLSKVDYFRKRFDEALGNDLNTPQALAVIWETAKSNIPPGDKRDLLLAFDSVLGLNLHIIPEEKIVEAIPQDVLDLAKKRDDLRKQKKFAEADTIREEIENNGYIAVDTSQGTTIKNK